MPILLVVQFFVQFRFAYKLYQAQFSRRQGSPTARVTLARGLKDSPGLQAKFTGWVTLLPETTLRLLRFGCLVSKARTDSKTGKIIYLQSENMKNCERTYCFLGHNSLILPVLGSYFAFGSQNRVVPGRRVVPSRAFTSSQGYPSARVTLAVSQGYPSCLVNASMKIRRNVRVSG